MSTWRVVLTRNLGDHRLWEFEVGSWHFNFTGLHGTETSQAHLTGVQLFRQCFGTVGREDKLGLDLARNPSNTMETKIQRTVIGGESDTEVGGREVGAVLTQTQGI